MTDNRLKTVEADMIAGAKNDAFAWEHRVAVVDHDQRRSAA
jgi:hypothetical protein